MLYLEENTRQQTLAGFETSQVKPCQNGRNDSTRESTLSSMS